MAEDAIATLAMLAMVVLPLLEIAVRRVFGVGVPGSGPIVQHLTLWVGFLGAAIAARDGKLLALATGTFIPAAARRAAPRTSFAAAVAACASLVLAWGGVQMVRGRARGAGRRSARGFRPGSRSGAAGGVRADRGSVWCGRPAAVDWIGLAASVGLAAAVVVHARRPWLAEGRAAWPGLVIVAIAAVLGTPLFAILGGAAALAVPARRRHAGRDSHRNLLAQRFADACRRSRCSRWPGFCSRKGARRNGCCVSSARSFGWIPGGTAVVCAVLCSFFTVFTGGSGVTILALGGVLFPALIRDGYRERFALGLLTASGSLGLLLPPALPLILYAVVAQIPIEDIFIGGILPGILLDGDGRGVGSARRHRVGRRPAAFRSARKRSPRCGRRSGSWRCRRSCSSRCSAALRRRSKPRR